MTPKGGEHSLRGGDLKKKEKMIGWSCKRGKKVAVGQPNGLDRESRELRNALSLEKEN